MSKDKSAEHTPLMKKNDEKKILATKSLVQQGSPASPPRSVLRRNIVATLIELAVLSPYGALN